MTIYSIKVISFFKKDVLDYSGISIDKESSYTKQLVTFETLDVFDSLQSIKMRASNQNIILTRKKEKIDQTFGKNISFLLNFLIFLLASNTMINNLEAKQNLVHSLYRTYRLNNQICKKIKFIREGFNEIIEKDVTTGKEAFLDKNKNLENSEKGESTNRSKKITKGKN